MRLLVVWLIVVMPPWTWADDPKPVAVSLVRGKLDAATEWVDAGQAERSREYRKIAAEPIPDEAKEPKYRAASAIFHAMITPPIDDLLDRNGAVVAAPRSARGDRPTSRHHGRQPESARTRPGVP